MQLANILLSLGGDHGNTVSKFNVSAAEIAVLRAIHGDESVKEVEPVGEEKRSHGAERTRLLNIYGHSKFPDRDVRVVESMFPGVAARLHETLDELELPEDYFKASQRMTSAEPAPGKWPTVDPDKGPTIAEWVKAGYPAEAYPPSPYKSKSTPEEIQAAIDAQAQGAEQTHDDDTGVGDDMDDDIGKKSDNVLG